MGDERRVAQPGESPDFLISTSNLYPRSLLGRMRHLLRQKYIALVDNPPDIKDGETFPMQYREPLESLWKDRGVQEAFARGNESALPENLP
jgi:hypothetical protein